MSKKCIALDENSHSPIIHPIRWGKSLRLQIPPVNNESAMARVQLALKGNERLDSDWFIARYTQKTPITQNRDNSFRPCAGRADHFPVVKLATGDSDMP